MTTKSIILLSVSILLLCFGLQAGASVTVQGYVLDPNWYAKHPQLGGTYGVGQYEYGVGGNATGVTQDPGLAWGTDIYGYFSESNMKDGVYALASWDNWWRQELRFGCDFTKVLSQNIKLHATMWSYAPTWDPNPYDDHGQVFKASGTSVTLLNIPAAGDTNRDYTVTFYEGGPNGPKVGSTSTVSGTGNMRIKWSGGRIPTVPGQLYYMKIHAIGANICNNEPIPDYSDPMPEGCLYHNGQPIIEKDLGVTLCSDDDGILTNMYIGKQKSNYGSFSSIGQTFTARGTHLLSFAAWINDAYSATYSARLYSSVNGTQIGPEKRAKVMRAGSGDPEIIWTWDPTECPLTPGQTYYIEVKRSDNSLIPNYFYSPWNEYWGGEAYVNGQPAVSGSNPWDLCGTIMEEESLGSATMPTVQFYSNPSVSRSDRGTNSVTIRWVTNAPSSSKVEYAAWNCPYTDTYYSSALVTSHVVTLTGLKPNTMYHIRTTSSATNMKPAVSRDFVACTNASTNLLVNGDFEEGSGSVPQRTIPGWSVYNGNTDFGVANGTWFSAGQLMPYKGSWFFEFAHNGSDTVDGKIYQTVDAVPGNDYLLTAAVSDWMQENNTYKYDVWYQNGRLPYIRLGIDPYGGNSPTSGTIEWTPKIYSHCHYITMGTKSVAKSNKVTVFVQCGGTGGQWQIFGIDNVQLSMVNNYPAYELKNLKSQANGTSAQVSDLIVTATPDEAGAYYAETQDRSQGIRIESADAVAKGTKLTVKGTLQSLPTGERYLANAIFSNLTDAAEPTPLMMLASAVGGSAFGTMPAVPASKGPHNTALVVKIAGTVTAKAQDSSYITIDDGSLSGGIRVDTSHLVAAAVPNVGAAVSVSGISSIYSDNGIKPMVIVRWYGDFSADYKQ